MSKLEYKDKPPEKDQKKFAKYLSEEEDLVLATGFSPHYLRQKFLLLLIAPGSVFVLFGLLIAYIYKYNLSYAIVFGLLTTLLFAGVKIYITYQSNRFILTTRRVIIKRGFFSVKVISALFDKITHIQVEQGFIDRVLLNHGTIFIHTAGTNKDEMILEYIESPIEFKNILERLINKERSALGHRPETLVPIEGEEV